MSFVDQSIQGRPAPSCLQIKASPHRSEYVSQRVYRDPADLAEFDLGDQPLRNAGAIRNVDLSLAESQTDPAQCGTQPDVLHGWIIAFDSYLALIQDVAVACLVTGRSANDRRIRQPDDGDECPERAIPTAIHGLAFELDLRQSGSRRSTVSTKVR